ncbi:unnamed protein product [Trichobilharzia regenti]|nr:unnamed protein product [Trichobilharzia regenti]
MEASFRISRRDLIHTELDVALGLEFSLIPPEGEILPHYQRIYKSLDLTLPLFPLSVFTVNNNNNNNSIVDKAMTTVNSLLDRHTKSSSSNNHNHKGTSASDSDSLKGDSLSLTTSSHSFVSLLHRYSPVLQT